MPVARFLRVPSPRSASTVIINILLQRGTIQEEELALALWQYKNLNELGDKAVGMRLQEGAKHKMIMSMMLLLPMHNRHWQGRAVKFDQPEN